MYKTQAGTISRDHFNAAHTSETRPENGNSSTDCPTSGKATTQDTNLNNAVLSLPGSKSHHDATPDQTMTHETSTKTQGVLVKVDHLERGGTPEQVQRAEKTKQRNSHKEPSEAQEATATKVTLTEPEAAPAQTNIKSTERTLLAEKRFKNTIKQKIFFEAQNATRSARAVAKGDVAVWA